MASFVEGLVAGYGIAIPVGAVAVLIVSTSMQCGFGIGFMAGAGAATADLLYAILASVAGVALVAILRPVAGSLRIVSGVALIALAASLIWRGLGRTGAQEKTADACGPLRMYVQFLGITIINPLTVVYFTAFILGRDPMSGLTPMGQVMFVLGVGIASLSWQTLLAGLGGIAGNRLSQRFRMLATILGNLLVVGLGLRILLSAVL